MPISAITLLLTEESETGCIHPLEQEQPQTNQGFASWVQHSKGIDFKALWFFSSIISPLEKLLQVQTVVPVRQVWTVVSWGQPHSTHSPQQQSRSSVPANSVFIHQNWWVGTNELPGIIQSMCSNYSSFAPILRFWACFPLQIILNKGFFYSLIQRNHKTIFFTWNKLWEFRKNGNILTGQQHYSLYWSSLVDDFQQVWHPTGSSVEHP